MPNVMVALPNMGGALCSTPQSLADAHYLTAVQLRCQEAKAVEISWGDPNYRTDLSRYRPKFTILWDIWRRYCCLTSFFPIVDMYLSCENIARQSCTMVRRWRFFCVLHFQRAACSTFQTAFYIHTKATPCVEVW